jgi:hypothetical protein
MLPSTFDGRPHCQQTKAQRALIKPTGEPRASMPPNRTSNAKCTRIDAMIGCPAGAVLVGVFEIADRSGALLNGIFLIIINMVASPQFHILLRAKRCSVEPAQGQKWFLRRHCQGGLTAPYAEAQTIRGGA